MLGKSLVSLHYDQSICTTFIVETVLQVVIVFPYSLLQLGVSGIVVAKGDLILNLLIDRSFRFFVLQQTISHIICQGKECESQRLSPPVIVCTAEDW